MNNVIKKVVGFVAASAMVLSMVVVAAPAANAATAGGVYSTPDGTVWFVTSDMQKRPFTSAGAFLSYGFLSWAQVMPADASVTSLPTGAFISPADGKIFCAASTKGSDVAGECALITGSMKASFTSAAVFSAQGHSFARAITGDSSFLTKTANIDNGSAAHLPGVLINNNGTVQMVVTGGLWGIPSIDVFNSWGYSFADVVPANASDLTKSQVGVIPARAAGQLVPGATSGPVTPTNPGDCNLDGNAGSVTVTESGEYSNEEVGEGEEDQGVLSFEVESDDDSDVAVTSVRIALYQATGADSQDIEDYIDEVKVWYGNTEVGSADADTFSETSDVYTKSISLDCSEVGAGDTGEFSISISAIANLESTDIDTDDWTAELYSVRFQDGDGVTTTQDVGDQDVTALVANDVQEDFDFVDFATANDVEFTVSLTDDMTDINETHNIIVDEDDATTDESILAFSIDASGDSDIWVDEIPVLFTTSDAQLAEVISKVDLYHGTSMVDSKSVTGTLGTSEVITFDDLDMTIDAGDEEDFTVKVRILSLTGNYAEGTTLKAELTSSEVDGIDAEDQEGDAIAAGNSKGTALGENHSLFSDGIVVDVTSADTNRVANDGANNDGVEFVWNVTIENIGDDTVFINSDVANIVSSDGANPAVDMIYAVEDGAATLTSLSGTIVDSGATEVAGGGDFAGQNFFSLAPGEAETFTITVTGVNSVASAQVRAYLSAIEWTVDDVTSFVGTEVINDYTANLPEDSETPYTLLN